MVVPRASTSASPEQVCRWFLRSLLEGAVVAPSLFERLRPMLKISPSLITHARYNTLGLALVHPVMKQRVDSRQRLSAAVNSDGDFLCREIGLWAKTGMARDVKSLWREAMHEA